MDGIEATAAPLDVLGVVRVPKLFALHVLAAFWHLWVRRDGLISRRML